MFIKLGRHVNHGKRLNPIDFEVRGQRLWVTFVITLVIEVNKVLFYL